MPPLLASTLCTPHVRARDVHVTEHALGRGSFGSVFRGTYAGCPVAVKLCTLSSSPANSRSRPAAVHFRRESARYEHLRHPCIVQFFGVVADGPRLLLLTELMNGGSLFTALADLREAGYAALPRDDVLRLAQQITHGLVYLHASAFSFGDLKTLNILLSDRPNLHTGRFSEHVRAKLCDFGLSRNLKHLVDPNEHDHATNPNETQIPARHGPAGTFAYLAPEAFGGLPVDDADAPKRADVYALGIVLWELATLQTPWPGLRALQLIGLVGRDGKRPEWPHNLSHLPPGYVDLVERCWAQDPMLRPTAEEVAQELDDMYSAFDASLQESEDWEMPSHDERKSTMLGVAADPTAPVRKESDFLLGLGVVHIADERVDDDLTASVLSHSDEMDRTMTSTVTGTSSRSYPSSLEYPLATEDIPYIPRVESMRISPDWDQQTYSNSQEKDSIQMSGPEKQVGQTAGMQTAVSISYSLKESPLGPLQRPPCPRRLDETQRQGSHSVLSPPQQNEIETELKKPPAHNDKWHPVLPTTSTIGLSDDGPHGPSNGSGGRGITRSYSLPAGIASSGDLDRIIEALGLEVVPDIDSLGVSMDTRPHFR